MWTTDAQGFWMLLSPTCSNPISWWWTSWYVQKAGPGLVPTGDRATGLTGPVKWRRSTGRFDRPVARLTGCLPGWPADRPVARLTGRLPVDQPVARLTSWLPGWLAGCLVDRLTGRLPWTAGWTCVCVFSWWFNGILWYSVMGFYGGLMGFNGIYPLVNIQFAMGNHHL